MATGGDDFECLSGAVVLLWLPDSSEEKDDSDDSLELLYTGMDAGELHEVKSCGNLSDSDVSNESGRGNENVFDPSLSGTSSGSVGVSRANIWLKLNRIAVRKVRKPSLVLLSESEENNSHGKAPKCDAFFR